MRLGLLRKCPVKGPPVLKCGHMAKLKDEAKELMKAGAEGLETIEVYDLQLTKRYKVKARKVVVQEPEDNNPPENTGDDENQTPDDTVE